MHRTAAPSRSTVHGSPVQWVLCQVPSGGFLPFRFHCSNILRDVTCTFWSENRVQICAVRPIAVAASLRASVRICLVRPASSCWIAYLLQTFWQFGSLCLQCLNVLFDVIVSPCVSSSGKKFANLTVDKSACRAERALNTFECRPESLTMWIRM